MQLYKYILAKPKLGLLILFPEDLKKYLCSNRYKDGQIEQLIDRYVMERQILDKIKDKMAR